MKKFNSITCINDNKVNNIDGCNFLQDVLNPYKLTLNINSQYSPIIHVCMNTHMGKTNF